MHRASILTSTSGLCQVVSALSVAFAHGGNDVGNSVGPLASLVEVYTTSAVQATQALPALPWLRAWTPESCVGNQLQPSQPSMAADEDRARSILTAALQQATPAVEYWELSIGAAGFVLGIMLLGSRA